MSIAAYVEKCYQTEEGLWVELCGVTECGVYTSPGHPRLLIENPTFVPEVGTGLWGGSSFVELMSDPPRRYDRIGYVRLRERSDWNR